MSSNSSTDKDEQNEEKEEEKEEKAKYAEIELYNKHNDQHDDDNEFTEKEFEMTEFLKTVDQHKKYVSCSCRSCFCCLTKLSKLSKLSTTKKMFIISMVLFVVGTLIPLRYMYVRMSSDNTQLSNVYWFWWIYVSFLILCVSISIFVTDYLIMKLLVKYTRNSNKVFYIDGLPKRLYLALSAILWYLGFMQFIDLIDFESEYDVFDELSAAILCILISALTFLASYIVIKFIALNFVFKSFVTKVSELKAYITMIEIMANIPETRKKYRENIKQSESKAKMTEIMETMTGRTKTKMTEIMEIMTGPTKTRKKDVATGNNKDLQKPTLFSMPLIEFLFNFPSTEEKEMKTNVSFRLIKEDKETMKEIANTMQQNAADVDDSNMIYNKITNLQYDLYSINFRQNINSIKKTNEDDLISLAEVLATLILLRLQKSKTSGNENDKNNGLIYKKDLTAIFQQKEGNNQILHKLGDFVWKILAPEPEIYLIESADEAIQAKKQKPDYLVVETLQTHIFKMFKKILELKSVIAAYTTIIQIIQTMIDVITPILLIFLYLYIFEVTFTDALGVYISIFSIIAVSASSVFSSLKFIFALNPFFVGDSIIYNDEYYEVEAISFFSCIFRHIMTGRLYQFQNQHLITSNAPIINLTRSENTNKVLLYQWVLYFKHDVTNDELEEFKKKCKHLLQNDIRTMSEKWDSINIIVNSIDTLQRKKVKISMEYESWKADIKTICFNYFTEAMSKCGLHWKPLTMINIPQNN